MKNSKNKTVDIVILDMNNIMLIILVLEHPATLKYDDLFMFLVFID